MEIKVNPVEQISSDISEGKTFLFCKKHFYTPSKVSKPTPGCKDCWQALYVTIWAKQPTDEDRREFVEGLGSAIHHFAEHLDAGTWDLKLLEKPTISVEHIDDEIYDEKIHLTKEG